MKWSMKWPNGNILSRHTFLWPYMPSCGALWWSLNIRWRGCTTLCHWLRDITLSSNDALKETISGKDTEFPRETQSKGDLSFENQMKNHVEGTYLTPSKSTHTSSSNVKKSGIFIGSKICSNFLEKCKITIIGSLWPQIYIGKLRFYSVKCILLNTKLWKTDLNVVTYCTIFLISSYYCFTNEWIIMLNQ